MMKEKKMVLTNFLLEFGINVSSAPLCANLELVLVASFGGNICNYCFEFPQANFEEKHNISTKV